MSEAEARKKAAQLLEMADDEYLSVAWHEEGFNGPGWYCWCTEYPEEGSDFVGV